jgi:hypothetical protein
MNKFTNLLQELKKVGLNNLSKDLERFSSTLKYVYAADTSKEIEVFNNIISIVSTSQGMEDDKATFPAGSFLAPYSMETDKEFIIFNRHPLAGASKKDVMRIGLPNYIDGFIKYYMENRASSMHGNAKSKYLHAIAILERVKKDLTKSSRYHHDDSEESLEKTRLSPVYKDSARKAQKSLFSHLADMNKFKTLTIQKWIPAFLESKTSVKKEPKEEQEEEKLQEEVSADNFTSGDLGEEVTDLGMGEEEVLSHERLKESSLRSFTKRASDGNVEIVDSIHKLDSNFEQIREEVDSSFASKLEMSIEEFRSFIKEEDWLQEAEHLAENIKKTSSISKFKIALGVGISDQIMNQTIQPHSTDEKRIPEILKGKFIFFKKDPTSRRKIPELVTAKKLEDSWEIMQKELRLRYVFLIEQLIMLYKYKKTYSPRSQTKNKINEKTILEDLNRGISKLQGGN